KVVDVTDGTPRSLYGIGGRSQSGLSGGFIPGPHQMKLKVPMGAKSVSVTAQVGADPLGLGGGTPTLKLLARANSPISFGKSGGTLQNDATATVDFTVMNGGANATANIDVPCAATSEVYVTIANNGANAATLGNV